MLFLFSQAGAREGWGPGDWGQGEEGWGPDDWGGGARRGREYLTDIFVTLVLFLLLLNPYICGLITVCPGEVIGHLPGELIIGFVSLVSVIPVTHPAGV